MQKINDNNHVMLGNQREETTTFCWFT